MICGHPTSLFPVSIMTGIQEKDEREKEKYIGRAMEGESS